MGRILRAQGSVERGQHGTLCKICKGRRQVSAPPCQPKYLVKRVLAERDGDRSRGMTSINDALWSIMFRCRHPISVPNRHRRTDVTAELTV